MPKDKYTLYLDESTSHDGAFRNETFCMAGIIIKDSDYPTISSRLDNLKSQIWHDKADPLSISIHQKDVRDGQQGSINNPDYIRFRSHRYSRMGSVNSFVLSGFPG